MKFLKTVLLVLSIYVAYLSSANPALASEAAIDSASCLTPVGSVIADYQDGTHGIVGQGSMVGKDTVYQLPNGNALQCFCSVTEGGVQTNWVKTSTLSEDQIKIYENQGWMYVPSGAAWGLSDEPYLAQNMSYGCLHFPSTGGGSDGHTDGQSSNGGTSIVQAAKGSNLASTGNVLFIIEIFSVGLFMVVIGLILRRKAN
jgi:hypothetical protein